jgi:hypothetical protein
VDRVLPAQQQLHSMQLTHVCYHLHWKWYWVKLQGRATPVIDCLMGWLPAAGWHADSLSRRDPAEQWGVGQEGGSSMSDLAYLGSTYLQQPNHDCELPIAFDELFRAVNGVNYPAVLVVLQDNTSSTQQRLSIAVIVFVV